RRSTFSRPATAVREHGVAGFRSAGSMWDDAKQRPRRGSHAGQAGRSRCRAIRLTAASPGARSSARRRPRTAGAPELTMILARSLLALAVAPSLVATLEAQDLDASTASTRTADLYVIAGQSNAEGLGDRAELPDVLARRFVGVQIHDDQRGRGHWSPLEVGVNHLSTHESKGSRRVGFESSLAHELSAAGP